MGNNKKHSVVGLFSGCGGLDLGFINSGYEVVWANDFFKDAVEPVLLAEKVAEEIKIRIRPI